MTLDEIQELYFITPIDSVPSILQHGILSHNRAKKILHTDISMAEIQERRARKKVFGGRPLHDYANSYFDAHNPMLSKRRDQNEVLCVLRISKEILQLPKVVITDRNAAGDYVKFYPSPQGLHYLDKEKIFAKYWTHSNQFEYMEHKSIKCAEALVPGCIASEYIQGAYVYNSTVLTSLQESGFALPIEIKNEIFF